MSNKFNPENLTKQFMLLYPMTKKVNDDIIVDFEAAHISGPYYDEETSEYIFHTEQEAVEYACKDTNVANFIVVPYYSYRNY